MPHLTKVDAPLSALASPDEEVEDADGLGYTAWCEAQQVRAIRARRASEHSMTTEHFYFAGDSLVFVLREVQSEFPDAATERMYLRGQ